MSFETQRDLLWEVLVELDNRGLLPECSETLNPDGTCRVCTALESVSDY